MYIILSYLYRPFTACWLINICRANISHLFKGKEQTSQKARKYTEKFYYAYSRAPNLTFLKFILIGGFKFINGKFEA